jgi:transposase
VLLRSIVRETLGLKDHRVVRLFQGADRVYIELDRIGRRRLPCNKCGERSRVRDRLLERRWRHVPLWGIPVTLLYEPCRVRCRNCGIKVEEIPWSLGKSPLSQPLGVVLAFWSRLLPWQTVGQLFGASWSTVRTAVRHAVDYGIQMREDDVVLHIGIDEISRRRGHIYHTQVYDLHGKRLLWSAEGRDADTLRRFFDQLGPERCARIQAVCCDMWAPYAEVVKEKVPQAIFVFDKFHIVRHLLNAVNDVRKAEAKELRKQGCELLTGTRYIWLKNPWNLTPRQSARLSDLEKLNLKVNRAYLLKETFCHLWTYKRKGWAKRFFNQWFWWATHSRLEPMRKFAWMIRKHIDGILAWFDVPIDNGATEAMNNNAKAVSHRARGYRTADTFSLALMHSLGKLPLPCTVHRFW